MDPSPVARKTCPRCRRPDAACWCADLPVVPTRTHVVFLQHPRESRVAVGTARMAHLCLPNSELHVGIEWEEDPGFRKAISDPLRPAVLLFPGPEAPDILLGPPGHPVTLVVVDGTWSQAAKLVHRNQSLRALPRYAFRPPSASEYRIRREPAEDCVSTIEALVHVLGVLEADAEGMRSLLAPFRRMVDFQVRHAEVCHAPRTRVRRRPAPPPPALPAALTSRPGDLLCVAGEANAWPRAAATGIPDELVHWVAVRPATGQRFEAILAPRRPLAPSAAGHCEIPAQRLLAGESWESFAARWASFLRPSDVLCSWGCHSTGLVTNEGGCLPEVRIDVRQVLREFHRRKIGSLEDWQAAHGGPTEACGQGRAGTRLGMLTDVIARLLETRL